MLSLTEQNNNSNIYIQRKKKVKCFELPIGINIFEMKFQGASLRYNGDTVGAEDDEGYNKENPS